MNDDDATYWEGIKTFRNGDYLNPDNAEAEAELTLPPNMNSDEAIYWIRRAEELFPEEDIKIQIGE